MHVAKLCMYTHMMYSYFIVIVKYKTKLTILEGKLTASMVEQQELLRVLDQTKRMCYARDLQISMLESDSQLMLEKGEYIDLLNYSSLGAYV